MICYWWILGRNKHHSGLFGEFCQICFVWSLENLISGLQDATLVLDDRLTNLEENGGGSVNLTALETRVSQLEVTTGEQETQITANEDAIEGKCVILNKFLSLTSHPSFQQINIHHEL